MSHLDQYLKDLEAIALSCDQLISMSAKVYYNGKKPRIKCMLYDDIPDHSNINKIMADLDSLIILYQIKPEGGGLSGGVGHFICITKRGHSKYSHFDSYGLSVDEEIHLTHENPNIIKNLLAGVEYDTNKKRLQAFKNDVNTCGLHTLFRSLFFNMNNSEYLNYIKPMVKKINPDDLVTLIFRFLIK